MLNTNSFKSNILRIIEKFETDFFIIQPNNNINCKCIDFNSKQADPNCKICLGTGHKILIKKIKGAYREDTTGTSSQSTSNKKTIFRYYYINKIYPVYKNNIIIDGDDVFFIYESKNLRAFKENIYQLAICYNKKFDSDILLNNFNNIIGRKK